MTATKSGLRFAVPDDWASIDAEKVLAGESNPGVDQLLETMGVTQEQFAQSLAGMDLMVMGPMDGTFAPNVNVVPNVLSELPPAANLASELSSVGAGRRESAASNRARPVDPPGAAITLRARCARRCEYSSCRNSSATPISTFESEPMPNRPPCSRKRGVEKVPSPRLASVTGQRPATAPARAMPMVSSSVI